ncbi:MAG: GNAT family N-acetyltransferase [Clostridiales bacterium]|jgi:ribosomal protein S18 acetylase RimI-like enzyme|nr:GNAT family N-acetyltransferase [Clostridiales bacterium]
MEQREIKPVSPEEINKLSRLAEEIWTEHYAGIISQGQISYMVEKFQSSHAIQEQIRQGYHYFWLCLNGQTAGYLSIKPEDGSLFLSKIYIQKEYRGKKLAACAVNYLTTVCQQQGLSNIWLTVNKRNSGSIAAYERLGFHKVREQTADIGQGYVMDDYIMELPIS